MVKLSDELKEKVKRLVEEIIVSDLSDGEIETFSSRWVECIKEVFKENSIEYSEEDLEELKNSFLERLQFIKKYKESNNMVEDSV